MSVDIGGIFLKIGLAALSYGLIESGGTRIHGAITARREGRASVFKHKFTKQENPAKFYTWQIINFILGLFLCFIAGAIIYALLFAPAASALL